MSTMRHLSILGLRVQDKVTGFAGVVTSVCFDLYGCIQAAIDSGFDEKMVRIEPRWFDVSRLTILSETPVMDQPDFDTGPVAEGAHGPAEKPLLCS